MKKTLLLSLCAAAMALAGNAKTVDYTSATYNYRNASDPVTMVYGYEMSIDWNDAMTTAKSIECNHQATYESPFFGENVALKNGALSFKSDGKPVTITFDGDYATAKVGAKTIVFKRTEAAQKCDFDAVDLGLSVDWASYNVGTYNPEECGMTESWDTFNVNNNNTYYTEPWRVPTWDEFKELLNKCEYLRIEEGGNTYYRFFGPNDSSIILPVRLVVGGDPVEVTYWNSAVDDTDGGIATDAEREFMMGFCPRTNDCSVRLVRSK